MVNWQPEPIQLGLDNMNGLKARKPVIGRTGSRQTIARGAAGAVLSGQPDAPYRPRRTYGRATRHLTTPSPRLLIATKLIGAATLPTMAVTPGDGM